MKRFKKIFKLALSKWQSRMGLQAFEITTGYYHRFDPPDHDSAATITVLWPYKAASINVNGAIMSHLSDYKIESVAIHELSHILVEPARGNVLDEVEYATTMIERAFRYTEQQTRDECKQ